MSDVLFFLGGLITGGAFGFGWRAVRHLPAKRALDEQPDPKRAQQ